MEAWKSIICDSDDCVNEMFIPKNMRTIDNGLNKEALEKYKIYPEVDTEEVTQFTCPRCGNVTTWGVTRRVVAQELYRKYQRA